MVLFSLLVYFSSLQIAEPTIVTFSLLNCFNSLWIEPTGSGYSLFFNLLVCFSLLQITASLMGQSQNFKTGNTGFFFFFKINICRCP